MIDMRLKLFVFALIAASISWYFSSAHSEEIKGDTSHLTALQKHVTLNGGTEKPFQNEYWDHKEPGIYVDIISGEPLFSSTDKFKSGTGWPSFTQPIEANLVSKHKDARFGMIRTEVKSSSSGAHLGHVFHDGPKDKGGKRYCINSAALRFVPADQLIKEGYAQYAFLFPDLISVDEQDQASAKSPAPATLPKADYIAVFFYADWCPNCKQLVPEIDQARQILPKDSPILFITLDLTDKTTIFQSNMLAHALGIGDYFKEQGSATGYLAILETGTKKEVVQITSAQDANTIVTTLSGLTE